ncbi:glycosyltransferase family 39 protein [Pelagicoccus sp. NFK12]|uniref:Glycosyltransferase family 39 protein n=1 Tax=Pelagicoccus enzymogenes TaxID=2773457 RepID=A0A927F9F1_9BACT|nr:glycosyltransferase family 39 protein [Pelagicoccus enzymogenes]MBD5780772.1 glycosyltransferase family 39 protein [Pelagicoccus enzymogenes]
MNNSKTRSFRLWLFTGLLLATLIGLGSYVVAQALFSYRPQPVATEWNAQWIKAKGGGLYSGAFRKDIFLTSEVSRAWIRVAAKDAFELVVNGDTATRSYLWRPTRPFQNGLSEYGQRLNFSAPLLALNFPREYQWIGHKEYMVPAYIDVTNKLNKGRNAISILIESRKADACAILEGEILLNTGEVIRLQTDSSWHAWQTAPATTELDWMNPNQLPPEGGVSVIEENAPNWFYRTLPEEIFSEPFRPEIISPSLNEDRISFTYEKVWEIENDVSTAWMRILTNRNIDLFVNDRRVNTDTYGSNDYTMGEWAIGSQKALDPSARPSLLDPDEVGHVYAGKKFTNPRHSDPTVNDFHRYENTLNKTGESPSKAGQAPATNPLFNERQQINPNAGTFADYLPGGRAPEALTRNREDYQFIGFDLSSLLHPGRNTVKIRLNPKDTALRLNWLPSLALDAAATDRQGRSSRLQSDETWLVSTGTLASARFVSTRSAITSAIQLPSIKYRGFIYHQGDKLLAWFTLALVVALVVGASLVFSFWKQDINDESLSYLSRYQLLFPTSILLGIVMLRISWVERFEWVWLHYPWIWLAGAVAATLALGLGTIRVRRILRDDLPQKRRGRMLVTLVRTLPNSRYWKFIIFAHLLLAFALRAYHIDFQTIDDDEYASIQASLAIAEKGVPEYTADVWYTRSPLYHYLSGFFIWIFGPNIWVLRLPMVLFGVATTWLCYHSCKHLLGSAWLGIAAMLLYAFHPFLIFSSHIARFYQQQQFFALLTAYFFCKGFVSGAQEMKYRYYTLWCFLAAILSQELSVVIGFQLLFGYLLFAKRKPMSDELRTLVIAVCVVALTAIDIIVFQTRTLTRTEGISPNVEATLSPNFSSPMNYLSVFFSYSRLHLSLSVLFFLGLPLAFKNGNRNVLAMYYMMFSGVIFTNLLVTADSLRYQYWIIPLWIMLGLYCVKAILDYLDTFSLQKVRGKFRLGRTRILISTIVFTAIFISWSPWRIPGSYDTKILGDASGAFQYIRTHMRPTDRVGATEPHPHGILLETGRADYDIAMPLLYDFVYLTEGQLRDRNADALVVSTVEQLQSEFAKHDRVWIAINREKFRSRGKNLRWEYPGARAELFLRQQCSIEYQSYLWTVFLWDANRANYKAFRQNWNR